MRRGAWFEGATAQHACAGGFHTKREFDHLALAFDGAWSCNHDGHASAEAHCADFHRETATLGKLGMRASTDGRTDPRKVFEAHLSCNLLAHAGAPCFRYFAPCGSIAVGVSKIAMASIS